GLAPSLSFTPRHPQDRRSPSSVLVFAEAALAVMLLAGAGALIRSSWLVASLSRGLDTRNVLTAQVWLPPSRYVTKAEIARFWNRAVEQVSILPGVVSASAVSFPPLSVLSTSVGIELDGRVSSRPGEAPQVQYWVIDPRYFDTARVAL